MESLSRTDDPFFTFFSPKRDSMESFQKGLYRCAESTLSLQCLPFTSDCTVCELKNIEDTVTVHHQKWSENCCRLGERDVQTFKGPLCYLGWSQDVLSFGSSWTIQRWCMRDPLSWWQIHVFQANNFLECKMSARISWIYWIALTNWFLGCNGWLWNGSSAHPQSLTIFMAFSKCASDANSSRKENVRKSKQSLHYSGSGVETVCVPARIPPIAKQSTHESCVFSRNYSFNYYIFIIFNLHLYLIQLTPPTLDKLCLANCWWSCGFKMLYRQDPPGIRGLRCFWLHNALLHLAGGKYAVAK